MKQVVLRGGNPILTEVPAPSPAPGHVLVATSASVISSGTERSAVATGGSLPQRAARQPELVTRALKHAREHGIRETVELAKGVAAPDFPLGYACAGTVLDTGGVARLRVGQQVACAGHGWANHAEFVLVPGNLVAPVPAGLPLTAAAYATLGAIALHGCRRAELTLGERVVVVGLGLLGLLAVQILRASGCRVAGVDPIARRRQLAEELGAERAVEPPDALPFVASWSEGVGADAAVITASTPDDSLVNDAVKMLRGKGRVVPVGEIGLGLERGPLYQREADVLMSTSYGPGRHDRSYEEHGADYPIEYVRWTENRNLSSFLHLLSDGSVRVDGLTDRIMSVEDALEAYELLSGDNPPLAVVLTYDPSAALVRRAEVKRQSRQPAARTKEKLAVGLIGAGGFVREVHIRNLKRQEGARVKTVVTRSGKTADDAARLVPGATADTDWRETIADPEIDLVLVGTRHDSHAEITAAALRAGKAVFVEKPLGLTREQIDEVWDAGAENDRLAIGFNRPFAELARALEREVRESAGPIHLVYRVSSPLPPDHWLNDPAEGGGRILGEACHMFDFANWLCGVPRRVMAAAVPARESVETVESASATIEYDNGSVATVHYSGLGGEAMPKERVEVLRGAASWVLDDFRTLTSYASSGPRDRSVRRPDKGHAELLRRVLAAARGEREFEPGLEAAYAAQSVALAVLDSIASGAPVEVVMPDPR